MGFLTGAYLKMSSAKTRLNLQNQLTRITMRMQRITRDMGRMERQLNMMQRNCKMTLQGQLQQALAGGQSQFQIYMDPSNPNIFNNPNATEAEKQNMDQALRSYSIFQQAEMYRTSQAQAMWDDYFEQYREAMLEPLKDEEQALQMEKANIESRLKLTEGQEKAAEEMEKSSQKDFVPQYTGGG